MLEPMVVNIAIK